MNSNLSTLINADEHSLTLSSTKLGNIYITKRGKPLLNRYWWCV